MAAARTTLDFARRRLASQRLVGRGFAKAQDVVHWLGAVQAQDYAGAKWALAQRLTKATDDSIEQAFNAGRILRTHLLRPTWHFVVPGDIQWLLMLTAPRVHATNASLYRKLDINTSTVRQSRAALVNALRGGKSLTRDELRVELERGGVATSGEFRMSYIMMHAELEGVVCSGPRRGKQFTYALLEERIPRSRVLGKEEALGELADRFFTSRGPASVRDFAKWSGLTITDCRSGLDAVKHRLECDVTDRNQFWFATSKPIRKLSAVTAHLLSIYDEYVSGYKDRSPVIRDSHAKRLVAMGNALTGIVLLNGQIVGTWKRVLEKAAVRISIELFRKPTGVEKDALSIAAEKYGVFLGSKPVVQMTVVPIT